MSKLEFRHCYKIANNARWISNIPTHKDDPLKRITERNYFRYDCIISKLGIVLCCQMDWETNAPPSPFIQFETVFDGVLYKAYLNGISRINETRLKYWATKFINEAKELHNKGIEP